MVLESDDLCLGCLWDCCVVNDEEKMLIVWEKGRYKYCGRREEISETARVQY